MPNTDSSRTRIVILGGGFGGVYTAMALERRLRRRTDVEIALVNRENYMVFQPMLPEVISGTIGLLDTITPIRRLCPRTNLYTREVEGIDLTNRVVTTSAGFLPRPYELPYDHLVIALGTVTTFTEQPGLHEHALRFKYLGDALTLRNHAIHVLEEAAIESDPDTRRALLTFVVGGGGFSGVEAVAELNDFVRLAVRDFRNVQPADLRVMLIHAGPLILPELPPALAQFAQRVLQRRGVEIRLNAMLTEATRDAAFLDNGERIPTKTVVSTVPSSPNPIVAALPCRKERGRIVVNEYMEVPDYPGLWALGDCAAIPDRSTGQYCPPTAQHAIREGRCLADNIVASLERGPKKAFSFSALGKLAALGRHTAVAEILGLKLSGFFAWLLWRVIYLGKLPGFDRKARVATDWFLDLLLPPDIVQLKTQETPGVRRAHFEPGEVIFRQGDRGDRLYVIADGQVEIAAVDADGKEDVLARLRGGECFGEMALVNDLPRNATARVIDKANVITVDRDAFHQLFAHLPPLRALFTQLIERRQPAGGQARRDLFIVARTNKRLYEALSQAFAGSSVEVILDRRGAPSRPDGGRRTDEHGVDRRTNIEVEQQLKTAACAHVRRG